MKTPWQVIVVDALDVRNRLHHDRARLKSSLRSAFALACLCSGVVVVECDVRCREGAPIGHSIIRAGFTVESVGAVLIGGVVPVAPKVEECSEISGHMHVITGIG